MARLALLALCLFGFGVAGYAVFLWPTPAPTTYYLDAAPVDPADAQDDPVVEYEDLSTENRQLFDEALGNGTATVDSETAPLNARYVRFDGTVYETTVQATEPEDSAALDRLGMLAIGAGATLLGTFGLLGVWVTSWDRRRGERSDD